MRHPMVHDVNPETERKDYEPADSVPFPNSSSNIKDRAVLPLRASDTWLRSVMKAD